MITSNNIRQTFQELNSFGTRIDEMRTLVFSANRGSAQNMSPAELEFALRNCSNATINVYNAFLAFLQRLEADSRLRR